MLLRKDEKEAMFITRECDYAVRVVRSLAGQEKLSVGEICEMEGITAPFAYKILKKLEQAGYVKGYRGVHGGYMLQRKPESLTLLDVGALYGAPGTGMCSDGVLEYAETKKPAADSGRRMSIMPR